MRIHSSAYVFIASAHDSCYNLGMKKSLYLIVFIIFLLAFSSFLVWRSIPSAKYSAFYYPNANNLLNYNVLHDLNSLNECMSWIDEMSVGRSEGSFGYKCGKNCGNSETSRLKDCEEIFE